jgi:hypothetical protein
MPFEGKTLMQREIVDFVAPLWPTSKVKGTAVSLGESKGSLGAYNDNLDGDFLVSRDCGAMQINIPASAIGTELENSLRTASTDPVVYVPVAEHNFRVGRALYDQPMTRDGKPGWRRWQPWVAYTSGWAMFPEWWVWHQVNGVPAGPWMPSGRFVQQAIRAVANWHLLIAKDMDVKAALAEAERLAEKFNVTTGILDYSVRNAVFWHIPPHPTSPPLDGVGPRPVPNDGL